MIGVYEKNSTKYHGLEFFEDHENGVLSPWFGNFVEVLSIYKTNMQQVFLLDDYGAIW